MSDAILVLNAGSSSIKFLLFAERDGALDPVVRGQIRGAVLDGPLAFDNAISRDAARTKGIASEVAGDPDILLAPDLEAGNILAKQLTFLANADSAGIVLGARVPIILTSRADSVRARIASCGVAMLAAHARRQQLQATT